MQQYLTSHGIPDAQIIDLELPSGTKWINPKKAMCYTDVLKLGLQLPTEDQTTFWEFWRIYNLELRRYISAERDKSILSSYSCLKYGIYFFYIDDNDFSAALYKYNSDTNEWDIFACWRGVD